MSDHPSTSEIIPYPFASVVIDEGIDTPLDYKIPDHLTNNLHVGMRVHVPVRGHLRKATVYALKPSSDVPKVHTIHDLIKNEPYFPHDLFPLAEWMCHYYCCSFSELIPLFLPSYIRGKAQAKEQLWIEANTSKDLLKHACEKLRLKAPKQALILEALLKTEKGLLLTDLLKGTKLSKAPIDALVKQGLILQKNILIDRSFITSQEFLQSKPKSLNSDQAQALHDITSSIDSKQFKPHLIYGVTGSGKTEVFLQAIAHARAKNLGVIILIPEIALTTQTIERLKSRFPEQIAILHHRLSNGERFDQWHKIANGEIQLVLGARSAIFAPVKNLGLIIVDEEHENSYKQQEDSPCYHARDVAVMRGYFSKSTVVLASATPSFESMHNAKIGKYQLNVLKKRATDITLPHVTIVNMKTEFEKSQGYTLFSSPLLKAIKDTVAKGEQVLLFLNKRGFYRSVLCKTCLESYLCPYCDVSLTFHKALDVFMCHYCGYEEKEGQVICKTCKSKEHLAFKGFGTEQVEHLLNKLLPDIRIMRMDADTTRKKGSHEVLFKQFRSGKADILIGTQMVSKGFDIPNITLVGILQADQGLSTPDFRASEYVFQLITQVAGRSGRGSLMGQVILQTMVLDHPSIIYASKEDFEGFYEEEILSRKLFSYPPYAHFSKISFTSKSDSLALKTAEEMHLLLFKHLSEEHTIMPVLKHLVHKVLDTYRYHILIKGPSIMTISKTIKHIFKITSFPSKVRVLVDMDPTQTSN